MRAKKGECSKTHWNKNKKWKLFLVKKTRQRERTNMQKQIKLKVPNKRVKRQTMQKFQILVFERRSYTEKTKERKGTPCGRNEKTRREKRDNR